MYAKRDLWMKLMKFLATAFLTNRYALRACLRGENGGTDIPGTLFLLPTTLVQRFFRRQFDIYWRVMDGLKSIRDGVRMGRRPVSGISETITRLRKWAMFDSCLRSRHPSTPLSDLDVRFIFTMLLFSRSSCRALGMSIGPPSCPQKSGTRRGEELSP